MRQALGVLLHLAHLALLLIVALDDSSIRRLMRPDAHRLARESRVVPPYHARDQTARPVATVPSCPMPVWRPDPNVTYAAVVIGVDRVATGMPRPAPCVNPYVRSAASR